MVGAGQQLALCWTWQVFTWHSELGENPALISRTGFLATDNVKSYCRLAFMVNSIHVVAGAVW